MKITVIRAFLIGGIRQEPGSTLDLPDALAKEMLALNKAEAAVDLPVEAPAVEAPPPAKRTTRKDAK